MSDYYDASIMTTDHYASGVVSWSDGTVTRFGTYLPIGHKAEIRVVQIAETGAEVAQIVDREDGTVLAQEARPYRWPEPEQPSDPRVLAVRAVLDESLYDADVDWWPDTTAWAARIIAALDEA